MEHNTLNVHCEKSLFYFCFSSKFKLLRTENPDVHTRTFYPQPIEFSTIPHATKVTARKYRPVTTAIVGKSHPVTTATAGRSRFFTFPHAGKVTSRKLQQVTTDMTRKSWPVTADTAGKSWPVTTDKAGRS
jgi:hypothetical protein